MMEDMKNLLIQALETRGVLGQVRAKLRSSVFKIVDEQDQKFSMGCGLKWENTSLYKTSDTKVGTLSAELIREFMEYLKMDYSLSVFIPEFSISPERLRKEELFAKLGIQQESHLSSFESPTLYFMIYYFMHSIKNDPEKVYSVLNTLKESEIEKSSDELIDDNLREYFSKEHQVRLFM